MIRTPILAALLIAAHRTADAACFIEDKAYELRRKVQDKHERSKLRDSAIKISRASAAHKRALTRLNELKQAKHEAVTAFDVEIAKLRNVTDAKWFTYRKLLGFDK